MERDFVIESLRGPGGCPAPAELGEYLDGKAPELRSHVPACPHCQAELAMMRELLQGDPLAPELADVRWVESRIRPVTGVETAPGASWRTWFRFAPILATLLVVASLGIYLRRPVEPGEVRYGGSGELRSARVALAGPSGTLASPPAEFAWEAVAGAVRYQVSVEEVSGDLVWTGAAEGTSVAAPGDVTNKMLPGKTLVWRVVAFDARGGKIAESEAARFRMEPPR